MKNLAIILGRKNSKRLKGKNLLKIGGKTLVERAIDNAIKSKKFSKIIISSDDEKILNLKKKYNFIDFVKRKKNLSGSKVKVIQVVLNILKLNKDFQTATILLPTCPLRRHTDIISAFKIFEKNYLNTISVSKYEFPPEFSIFKSGNLYTPGNSSPLLKNKTRSQEFKKFLKPNGAIYIATVKRLLKYKNFYNKKINVFVMPRERSIDIDNEIDYELAKILFKKYDKK